MARCQQISMSWRAAWKTLSTFSFAISSKNGLRSMPGASGSMTTASSARRQLRHAEQRVIGGLAQEFGVDGDEGVVGQPFAGGRQFLRRGDQFHTGLT